MAKIITEELILDKLENKGYFDYSEMDENKVWSMLEKHYDCEVSDQWSNKHFDFYCYSETTSDGYEVFIATNNPDSVCISEDVHYYENDLSDEIAEAIQEGYNMYIDDLDAHYFMDAVESCYDNMMEKLKNEMEEQLINKGYERKTDTPAEATA